MANRNSLPPVNVIFQEAKPDPSPSLATIALRIVLAVILLALMRACEALV